MLPPFGHIDHVTELEDVDPADIEAGRFLGVAGDGTTHVYLPAPEGTGTRWVPLANGDPDDPAYLFTPDGEGLLVEAQW